MVKVYEFTRGAIREREQPVYQPPSPPDVEPIQLAYDGSLDAAMGLLVVLVAAFCSVASFTAGWLLHGLLR